VKLPLLRHGGAGNRASLSSDYLTLQQAQRVITAASYALFIGKPLTRHLTVRLERQGISDKEGVKAIGKLLTLLRDHVRKTTDGEIAYIWAREYGATIGGHVHIVLHLPAGYILQGQRARRWIERISGKPYERGTWKTKTVSGSKVGRVNNPGLYLANLATVIGYVIKGTAPDAAAMLELDRVKAQGRIIGKRCGCSQNIDATARGMETVRLHQVYTKVEPQG
jgi:hypothetical protein